jgi:hypothetical protein
MEFTTLFWAGMGFGAIVLVLHFLTSVQVDHGPMRYERWRAAFVMSRDRRAARREQSNQEPDFSQTTTTPATSNDALQSDATMSKLLLAGQARALAALVKAGKVTETEGIKLVFGVSPSSTNARYQAARAALKTELARLDNHYPQRTDAQRQARDALGLN